ncbi:MAG: DJ-1/PfpI family protein, partial [Eubacteriales bacterium]|nr:DJ-1/PfpI family protein [Eubacteriales bacterium]
IQVTTVSITDTKEVTTSHGITLKADTLFGENDYADADCLVLPGGMPGTVNLGAYTPLTELLKKQYGEEKRIAAICAAPTVLSDLGFLKERRATSYPARMKDLVCKELSEESVVVDGNITTSRGVGTAIDFSLSLISQLLNLEKAKEIAESIVFS